MTYGNWITLMFNLFKKSQNFTDIELAEKIYDFVMNYNGTIHNSKDIDENKYIINQSTGFFNYKNIVIKKLNPNGLGSYYDIFITGCVNVDELFSLNSMEAMYNHLDKNFNLNGSILQHNIKHLKKFLRL